MPRKAQPKSDAIERSKWKPLDMYAHQSNVVDAYKEGIKRFFLAWHRRAGKDVFTLDFARERMQERKGSYWHLFPFQVQAKRAIWKGIDARTGERFIDRAFPPHLRESENDTELSLSMFGSTWQMLGSDNYDRAIGANPCGIVFSEWALCDPAAWDYFRPILVENDGWAMFITTFRGRNHAYRLFENVRDLDHWYADLRTIDDTHRKNGKPIIAEADIQKEIKDGMDPSLVQQEFYCNPDAATSGAIFLRQHRRLMELDHIKPTINSRVIRIAWGSKDEGLAAVAIQDNQVVGVHCFTETNITDAAQAVARRHPYSPLIHHAVSPDPTVFGDIDGVGVVNANISLDEVSIHGATASLLNRVQCTSAAREKLVDFASAYAPYRDVLDDTELTHAALAQALAVANSASRITTKQRAPLDYSAADRSVI